MRGNYVNLVLVELIHRPHRPFENDGTQSIARLLEYAAQKLHFGRSEFGKNKIEYFFIPTRLFCPPGGRGRRNTDAHASKFFCFHSTDNTLEPFVPARAPIERYFHRAERQIEVVVNDDEPFGALFFLFLFFYPIPL